MKILLNNLSKKYGDFFAVKNFSAQISSGELVCLLGPSGCGKTTLLNLLCGIIPATDGSIFFDDVDVTKLSPNQRNIGMVFQNYALYPHLTVLDNIAFPLEVQKIKKSERRIKAQEIAKLVHVEDLLNRYPGQLSGGQQQRVAIARALIKKPQLLLMDEPLSNLDARLRLEMREEIRRIQQETGITTIFVTHDQDEAMAISDSIFLMKDGNLIQSGLSKDLYHQPNCKFVADFLGNPPINNLEGIWENNQFVLFENENIHNKTSISIDLPQNIPEQTKITLAIRSEAFVFDLKSNNSSRKLVCNKKSENQFFVAKVLKIYSMTREQIVVLKIGNWQVRCVLSDDAIFSVGDNVKVFLEEKGTFIFNSETGERLK